VQLGGVDGQQGGVVELILVGVGEGSRHLRHEEVPRNILVETRDSMIAAPADVTGNERRVRHYRPARDARMLVLSVSSSMEATGFPRRSHARGGARARAVGA
jgi:hypothetical protein